jgi:hypothetical protein
MLVVRDLMEGRLRQKECEWREYLKHNPHLRDSAVQSHCNIESNCQVEPPEGLLAISRVAHAH